MDDKTLNITNEGENASSICADEQSHTSIQSCNSVSPSKKKEKLEAESKHKRLTKIRLKICSNPDCGSKSNLYVAPYFVSAYYGFLVDKPNRRRVCQNCYKEAENHQNVLVKMLQEQKSIVLGPRKPKNHMVTIDDEECSDESVGSTEEVEIEEDVEELVKQLARKYNFQQQVDSSTEHLGNLTVKYF